MGKQVGDKLNETNGQIYQYCLEALNVQSGDHVLEIGMGIGAYARTIISSSTGVKYTGLDYSETMVSIARASATEVENDHQPQFRLGDVKQMSFLDNSFDKVLTVNTIYFCDEIHLSIREIYRVMKQSRQLSSACVQTIDEAIPIYGLWLLYVFRTRTHRDSGTIWV